MIYEDKYIHERKHDTYTYSYHDKLMFPFVCLLTHSFIHLI